MATTAVRVACLLAAESAAAQRANDNAVTAADDAFGTVVGSQSIGLYSPTNARGFNPTQAQNVRIEGFYFDQQTQSSNPFLFAGTDMRIGIAAQSYAFPSPSGIVDLKLRLPGDHSAASIVLTRGPLRAWSAEIDSQYAVSPLLSVGLILGDGHDFDYQYALHSNRRAISLLARIRPSENVEIAPFYGYIHNTESAELPYVYANGTDPLALFDEQTLPTQPWTTWKWNQTTAGILTRIGLTANWRLQSGLFRSSDQHAQNFDDLLLGIAADGQSHHLLDVPPAQTASSYSGDLRIVRSSQSDTTKSDLIVVLRGRRVEHHYGGDFLLDLGSQSIFHNVPIPEPLIAVSAESVDVVRQMSLGIDYTERWQGRGSLSLGALRTNYARETVAPGRAANTSHAQVTLPTVSASLNVLKRAALYSSYTRGLEDSMVAPAVAVNRGQPPPATPTWQLDGGVQVGMASSLRALVGGFKIHKTYFSLDASDRYTGIGDVSVQGVESSLNWASPLGVTLVAGAVWLQPRLEQHALALGPVGAVPIGPVPRTISLSADYAPPANRGFGASAQWTSWSSRVETFDGRYRLPGFATLNLGVRYMFKAVGRQCSTRLDVGNVTNARGVNLSATYLAQSQLRRNYTATFIADL